MTICSGKSFGSARTLILNKTCSSMPPPFFTPTASPVGFHRHHDGDLFVFGDFMEIHVQHLAVERMVLDFLHQRQALGRGRRPSTDRSTSTFSETEWWIRSSNSLALISRFCGVGLAAVNDGGHAAGGAQFLDSGRGAPASAEMLLMQLISFY